MEKRRMEEVALIVMKNNRRQDFFPVWWDIVRTKRELGWSDAKIKEYIRNPDPDIETIPVDVYIFNIADEVEKYGVTRAEFWGLRNIIDAELLDAFFAKI